MFWLTNVEPGDQSNPSTALRAGAVVTTRQGFLPPLRAFVVMVTFPGAYAPGCSLPPLRGWGTVTNDVGNIGKITIPPYRRELDKEWATGGSQKSLLDERK